MSVALRILRVYVSEKWEIGLPKSQGQRHNYTYSLRKNSCVQFNFFF